MQQAGAFYADSDTLQQFLDDECYTGERCRAKVKDFHDAFCRWLGERIKKQTLIAMMRRKGYEVKRQTDGRFFVGLAMKEHDFPYRMYK